MIATEPTDPTGPDLRDRDTARWVAGLFLACVLLQRFAVPGTPVALLLPAIIAWCAYGVVRGVVVIDRHRVALWLAAFGTTAMIIPIQDRFVPGAFISLTSWGLFMVVWAPFVLRLVDVRTAAYLMMLRMVARVAGWLAIASVAMVATQLAGLSYVDWFARIVPDGFELTGFVITYPVEYGSGIYRANAWIGLEPSMISAQLGLGLLAAVYTGQSARRLAVLVLGLACTFSGSGFAIVGVGLLVLVVHPGRRLLGRYVPLSFVLAVAAATTSLGSALLNRVTEFRTTDSSTSLRAIEPYRYLWSTWVRDVPGILLGRGPGSAQEIISNSHILGLLVPSPVKVFFEYGLLAGAVLAVFLLSCYLGGPSRGFSVALLVSLWLLQPGTTTVLVVAPVLIFVTLWAPREDWPLETRPDRAPAAAGQSPVSSPWVRTR